MRPSRSRLWWRRWRSGAYDPVAVALAALVEKLRRYAAEDPGYFADDLAALETAGRLEVPARGTLDALFAVCQDYRMTERQVRACLRGLGMSRSGWLSEHWRDSAEPGGGA